MRSGLLVSWLRERLYRRERPERTFVASVAQHVASSDRILDVGCGFDTATLKRLTGRRVGVDRVEHFTPASGVQVVRADAHCLPFLSRQFDVACSRSVLEHLDDPGQMFREVARVLRPGGYFILLTPNQWDYVSLAAMLIPNRWHARLVRYTTGRPEERTFPTLYRANSLPILRRLSSVAGLEIRRIDLLRQHPHYLQAYSLLYLMGVFVEQALQRPVPVLRPWIFAVLQVPNEGSG
jgi:SAM-dependent methyltransferase